MKGKAIIFGVTGQDGYYLSKLLQNQGIDIVGVSRSAANYPGDVSDFLFVESLVKKHRPDYVFHLAANSTTRHHAIFDNHKAISTGTLNILESVRCHQPTAKVFLSGSAMQFKNEGVPISEDSTFDASSPYSVSRIHSVYAGRYFRKAFEMKVYVGYFFNHDSPLRSEHHVNQKVVRAVQRILSGEDHKLKIGNIDVRKEFNFAGDVVEAIWTLVNQEKTWEAIIGCGEAFSIKDWIVRCFEGTGLDWRAYVSPESDFVPEYDILVSNPAVIKGLGWRPKVDFNKLVTLMMSNNI